VPIISPENLPIFRIGLKCFFEEGRALARISHPNVVSVLNFFRANDTVYMVMAYESGRSLQEHILQTIDQIESHGVSLGAQSGIELLRRSTASGHNEARWLRECQAQELLLAEVTRQASNRFRR